MPNDRRPEDMTRITTPELADYTPKPPATVEYE